MDALLIAAVSGGIGILGVVIGSWITNSFAEKRLNSEHREWYKRERFKERSSALKAINNQMTLCMDRLEPYKVITPKSENILYANVTDPINEFAFVKAKGSIWCGRETEKIFSELLGEFRKAALIILDAVPEKNNSENPKTPYKWKFSWNELDRKYHRAKQEIKMLLEV